MKIQVTANTSFMHGRVHMHAGDTAEFTKGDAQELIDAGLVRVGGAEQPAEQAAEGADDLLGDGAKMDRAPENKMDDAPENKAVAKKSRARSE